MASDIGPLLQAYLANDPTIGGMVANRIYPLGYLPQKTDFPAVTYQMISDLPIEQLKGPASADEPRYQIDSWGKTAQAAIDLNAAIRERLEAFVGWWDNGSPATSWAFVQVRLITVRENFDPDILGGLCRRSADYFIFHSNMRSTTS